MCGKTSNGEEKDEAADARHKTRKICGRRIREMCRVWRGIPAESGYVFKQARSEALRPVLRGRRSTVEPLGNYFVGQVSGAVLHNRIALVK